MYAGVLSVCVCEGIGFPGTEVIVTLLTAMWRMGTEFAPLKSKHCS